MPAFDYKCESCDITVEVTHGMLETPEIKCANCGRPMQKQIGAGGGVIFKGPGFYCNDYPKDPKKRKEK